MPSNTYDGDTSKLDTILKRLKVEMEQRHALYEGAKAGATSENSRQIQEQLMEDYAHALRAYNAFLLACFGHPRGVLLNVVLR